MQLPVAFRSLSRLSSAPGAKASVLRPFWLDLLAYTLAYVYAAFSFFSWFSCIPSLKGMLSAHRFFFPFDLWFRSVFGFQGAVIYNNLAMPFATHFVLRSCALSHYCFFARCFCKLACNHHCSMQHRSLLPTMSGIRLFSRAVSGTVPSAAVGLTVVFGMGTGVSRPRIDTGQWRWRDSNS